MRINNPKALMTFNSGETAEEKAYSLATFGQLTNAIDVLNKKFVDLLVGTAENKNGLPGFTKKTGYAWLDDSGKLPASLMPSLAVTEVFAVEQDTIITQSIDETSPIPRENVNTKMQKWMSDSPTDKDGNPVNLQKGDIIVIIPGQDQTVDPLYCGAYITTEVPTDEGGDYNFSRISYEASKIVSIDGKTPDSAGILTLTPTDIFKMDNASDAEALVASLWRFKTVFKDDGSNEIDRFSFNDETYAKSTELDAEASKRALDIDALSAVITRHTDEIGKRNASAAYSLDDPIFPQLYGLRNLVDNNATVLSAVMTDTNDYLATLENQLKNLVNGSLNGKVIELKEQTFSFTKGNEISDTDPVTISKDDVEGSEPILIQKTGKVNWTYTFIPSTDAKDERVIAVFDEDGNQFFPDMQRVPGSASSEAKNTLITLVMDKVVKRVGDIETDLSNINGKTFTLLYASTLKVGMTPDEITTFDVAKEKHVYTSSDHAGL